MELKPLDRSAVQYQSVFTTWLSTPNLTYNEVTLLQALLDAVGRSLAEFDQMRRIATDPAFLPHLQSAAAKALAAGKLTSWSDHFASQT